MKRHLIISIILIIVFIVPFIAYAKTLTRSFGGKVLLTSIPDVECYSSGTGPVVLFSNVMSVVSGVSSAAGVGHQNTVNRVSNVANGVYNAIPFYTLSMSKTPKQGDWILGRANVVPSFETCDLQVGPYQIPFPVKTTNNYNISGSSY